MRKAGVTDIASRNIFVNGGAGSFSATVAGCDTFMQMVGVPHPSPCKARKCRDIDRKSALAGRAAATKQGVARRVYWSATPFAEGKAPAMRVDVASRAEAEARIASHVGAGRSGCGADARRRKPGNVDQRHWRAADSRDWCSTFPSLIRKASDRCGWLVACTYARPRWPILVPASRQGCRGRWCSGGWNPCLAPRRDCRGGKGA